MPSGYIVEIIIIASCGAGFFLFYKFWWEKRIDRKDCIEMLRSKGIADHPESITKRYYKLQGDNLTEKEVRKLTNQYIHLNKEFFLTMYDLDKRGENDKENNNKEIK